MATNCFSRRILALFFSFSIAWRRSCLLLFNPSAFNLLVCSSPPLVTICLTNSGTSPFPYSLMTLYISFVSFADFFHSGQFDRAFSCFFFLFLWYCRNRFITVKISFILVLRLLSFIVSMVSRLYGFAPWRCKRLSMNNDMSHLWYSKLLKNNPRYRYVLNFLLTVPWFFKCSTCWDVAKKTVLRHVWNMEQLH